MHDDAISIEYFHLEFKDLEFESNYSFKYIIYVRQEDTCTEVSNHKSY